MAPQGWTILEESSTSINVRSPDGDAGVLAGYGDFGGDPQPMTIPRFFEALDISDLNAVHLRNVPPTS
jgi:hypothetical protein